MILNGISLLEAAPIKGMLDIKDRAHGVSHGLGEAGYDIRLKQEIVFQPENATNPAGVWVDDKYRSGRFCIASAIEEFDMPPYLVGIVHDKSTWARRGLSVFNTVIEPGWRGFLTLELVYHGGDRLHIPAGAGIAQVIFHDLASPAAYDGKYQDQADQPVGAKHG
jgi:dCTP deaminase